MKTSKGKTTGRPMRSSKVTTAEEPSTVSKTLRGNKVRKQAKEESSVKPLPSEEEIRIKAKEIYLRRIERGEYGNAIDDWRKAEELLKGS